MAEQVSGIKTTQFLVDFKVVSLVVVEQVGLLFFGHNFGVVLGLRVVFSHQTVQLAQYGEAQAFCSIHLLRLTRAKLMHF